MDLVACKNPMSVLLITVNFKIIIIFSTDQLNTCVQRTMKATPFELVFDQPPHSTVFPGVSGLVMEEDVEDILTEEGR